MADIALDRSAPGACSPNGVPACGSCTNVAMKECPAGNNVRTMLRAAALRPTRQRLALAQLIFAKGDRHLTAEMLFEDAMRAQVPVSLATVYNTLHQFTEAGMLRQLSVDGARTYFDTNPSDHHHFFVEDDETLIDYPLEHLPLSAFLAAPEGMEITRVDVIVRLRRRIDSG